jgi:Ran GTPase-activating protein (RanGAP) involved in mRNA processing and transport
VLSALLLKTDTVEDLDLSYNQINAKSMFCLAEALTINQSLKYLSLEGNPLGTSGINFLMKSRTKNITNDFKLNIKLAEGEADAAADSSISLFDSSNPEGSYSLDLTQTYD